MQTSKINSNNQQEIKDSKVKVPKELLDKKLEEKEKLVADKKIINK